jgi:hypothetical protein
VDYQHKARVSAINIQSLLTCYHCLRKIGAFFPTRVTIVVYFLILTCGNLDTRKLTLSVESFMLYSKLSHCCFQSPLQIGAVDSLSNGRG